MSDLGQLIRVPAVRFERRLKGPMTRVWEHLTSPARLPGWYGEESTLEPKEGGRVSLMGGHIVGVVTQWQPPRKYVHTWNVFSPGETTSPYPESYLTVELEADGAEVRLTLIHMPVLERFEGQNAMGWATFLDILGDTLAGEAPKPRRAYMEKNAALYGVDLHNLAR